MSHGLDLGPIARVELACRDLHRQRDFYTRILGLPPQRGNEARFRIGQLELVLRPRGDALFPRADEVRPPPEMGALLAFPVPPHELDRWYRRMLTARVAGAGGARRRPARRRACCGWRTPRATSSNSSPSSDASPTAHAAAAIAGGGALLLWPAFLNGYPLVFSDTGAFLEQTAAAALPAWDKPVVYGPLLHAFHWRLSLWPAAAAQALLLSWLLWRTGRMLRGRAEAGGAPAAGGRALRASPPRPGSLRC